MDCKKLRLYYGTEWSMIVYNERDGIWKEAAIL
jgi:hypothetical protein